MDKPVPLVIVTRLRQKLPVEAEDVKSPSTPLTPSKKRGRASAKLQLELIDENASENVPRRVTRKSTTKDIEPVDDKLLTPSRRSARIRSNTSIVSETAEVLESPRAKRVTRRNSQVGSDTETPLPTSARTTRRTRKDSNSSVDKPVDVIPMSKINDIIIEELDINADERDKKELTGKNKTLNLKKIDINFEIQNDKLTPSNDTEKRADVNIKSSKDNTPVTSPKDIVQSAEIESAKALSSQKINEFNSSPLDVSHDEKENLSVSSSNLLKTMNTDLKKMRDFFNKSTPDLTETSKFKNKRQRTKSFTTINTNFDNEAYFLSDNERAKKKVKNKVNLKMNKSSDGSKKFEDSPKKHEPDEIKLDLSRDNKKNELLMSEETNKPDIDVQDYNVTNKEGSSQHKNAITTTTLLLQKDPSDFQISVVFESDSNSSSIEKKDKNKNLDIEDQCVPVVDTNANNSCEPMDIDETIPGDILLHDLSTNNVSGELNMSDQNKSKRKSSLSVVKDTFEDFKNVTEVISSNIAIEDNVTNNNNFEKSTINATLRSSQEQIHEMNGDQVNENTVTIIPNVKKSTRKSSVSALSENQVDINKETNKSKRISSINSLLESSSDATKADCEKSVRNSSLCVTLDENAGSNNSSKKSNSKSTIMMEIGDIFNNGEFDLNNKLSTFYADKDVNDSTMNSGLFIKKSYGVKAEDIATNPKRTSLINIDSEDSNVSVKSQKNTSIICPSQKHTEINKNSEKGKIISSQIIPSEDAVSEILDKSRKKSSFHETSELSTNDESCKKSKRKKSISQIETINNLENTSNESKSTFILSQIKDTSHETSRLSKTSKLHKKDLISKSLDTPNITKDKDYDNKNISLNCLTTSTPLQQKPPKKLDLLVDTSNVSLKDKKKVENFKNVSTKETSVKSFNESSDSDCSDSEVESSTNDSNMIDDKAKEASDDYESGDSRDDEEREYEQNNEILEQGETLDSEEDFSYDSDYEKDSFIVSSDEDDNELLSGSGDDLSMSPNELTMSKESKKKYNDRKSKEQKKASKEIYEARHKLLENNIPKSKKSNRQRIDSSLVTTDDEGSITKPKRNKRMRIDSSYDIDNNDSELNTLENKKKNKRLSESLCDKSALNEKEITLYEHNVLENDPLLIVKQEPETPRNDLKISTDHVTDRQDVEEIQVDENMSMIKPNETSDPLLQSTMRAENDDNSSLSENEEIIQNYNSMLHNLSNVKHKQNKTLDITQNTDNKKKNVKAPIIDEFNLTEVVLKKKMDRTDPLKVAKIKDKVIFDKPQPILNSDMESSSSSIDLKLLFPEDSNDSEVNANILKSKEEILNSTHDFIPLKKSEGATNITLGKDGKNESISEVKKKNKNRKSSEQSSLENVFDIEGTQEHYGTAGNTSKNSLKKKKLRKNKTIDLTDTENVPVETLYTNDKIEKKKHSMPVETSKAIVKITSAVDDTPIETHSQSLKKKKKSKHSKDLPEHIIEEQQETSVKITSAVDDTPIETQSQSPKKKKKKSKDLPEHIIEEQQETSVKITSAVDDTPIETQSQSPKKKKKKSKDLPEHIIEEQQETSVKITSAVDDTPIETQSQSPKKKKKKSKDLPEHIIEEQQETSVKITSAVDDAPIETQSQSPKKKKKSKHSKDLPEHIIEDQQETSEEISISNTEEEESISKKRKRKLSANSFIEVACIQVAPEAVDAYKALDESIQTGSKKKKRKITYTDKECTVENTVTHCEKSDQIEGKKLKRNKKSNLEPEVVQKLEPEIMVVTKDRKRKYTNNEDATRKVKVPKQNSFDKIHVTRLPDTVINQLCEKRKPSTEKKKYALSTTPFVVEEIVKRQTKPSNYLEESVYLNDSPKPKKQKYPFKDVKVLPFMPTVTTSYKGFTTDFKVKVLEENIQSVAQASSSHNFKNKYLENKRIKKLGTLEKYKRGRNAKISKF